MSSDNEVMQWHKLQRLINQVGSDADKQHRVEIMEMTTDVLPEDIRTKSDTLLPSETSEKIRAQYAEKLSHA